MKRYVPCFVEKAGFEPRTLGTKWSAMTTALHAWWATLFIKENLTVLPGEELVYD